MRRFAWPYLSALATMLVLDGGWLTIMGPRLYKPALGDELAPTVRPVPAVLFYLLYAAGLTALSAGRDKPDSLRRGAMFGLTAYATYDLTNQATLRQWPTYLTAADLGWGTLISAAAAYAAATVRERVR